MEGLDYNPPCEEVVQAQMDGFVDQEICINYMGSNKNRFVIPDCQTTFFSSILWEPLPDCRTMRQRCVCGLAMCVALLASVFVDLPLTQS